MATPYYRTYRPHAARTITPQQVFALEAGKMHSCDPALAVALAQALDLPWEEVLLWEWPVPEQALPDLWVTLTGLGLNPDQIRAALAFVDFVRVYPPYRQGEHKKSSHLQN